MRAIFVLSMVLAVVLVGSARAIDPDPRHVRPYRVLREESVGQVDGRSARRWIIASDAGTRDEFAHTAMQALLDLHRQFGADHTGVRLVASEALERAGINYASASYAADSLGSKGFHNGVDTRFRYVWFVRAAEYPLSPREVRIAELWPVLRPRFPSKQPWSSLGYDREGLIRAVADSLGIEREVIKAPYLFTPLYYDDIREGRPLDIR